MQITFIKQVMFFTLVIFIFSSAGIVFSQDDDPFTTIESEIEDELKWLQAEALVMTTIATKTKMDADLVPGMVTVLQSQYLKKHGVHTVFEALSFVPGLNTSRNSMGNVIVSVRGIGGHFFSGNLKLMLDGVTVNDSLNASAHALYQIPVEQIDRLEIIRGPGSVIYGEYAYAGVINVITKKDKNKIFARYNNNKGYGAGTSALYENIDKGLNLSASLYGWKSDGPNIKTGEDRLYGMGLGPFSYAPGLTNEAQEDKIANLSLSYKKFSLKGQYISAAKGDYFGVITVLPYPEDEIREKNKHMAFEAEQSLNLSKSLTADIKVGWREYEFQLYDIVALQPIIIPLEDGSFYNVTPDEGSIAGPYYEEQELYAGTDFILEGFKDNTILLGIKYSQTKMGDVWVNANTNDNFWGTMLRLTGKDNWLQEDKKRKVFSIYFQDMFNITENFSLTAGIRYDNYDDMKDYITPRLSAVWAVTNNHIVKAQYSEAYRPPTFTELYSQGNSLLAGNPKLDSEHIKSYELSYTYRNLKTSAHMTLFWSELEDNIEYPTYADQFDGDVQYFNASETIFTRGIEMEFNHDLCDYLHLDLNLSFADTENKETSQSLEGAAKWLGNASIIYMPVQNYALTMRYHYVGERNRASDDNRDDLDAYDTIDLTASVFYKGFKYQAGVTNLFNSKIIYPAPVYKNLEDNICYTYQDDYPRAGRSFWCQVSYDF